MATQKWIDLRDKQSGAKLKLDQVGANRFLFVVGMSRLNPKWQRAIDELGFQAASNQKFLIRLVQPEERIKVASFQNIWPQAMYAEMPPEQIGLNLSRAATASGKRSAEERDIANELSNARRLGRNADGDEVYERDTGRLISRDGGRDLVVESRSLRPSLFLRAESAQGLDECADGFVRSMMMNEVLRADDLDRFIQAVTGRGPKQIAQADLDLAHEVIDAAVTRQLTRDHETANDAYGDSVRLYEYMPTYRGTARGAAAMPGPLAIIAQRLLGDTTGKYVVLPNAFDGAGFSFLPKGTRIRAFTGQRDLSERARGLDRDGLEWHKEFHPARESNAEAMLFNADRGPTGARTDYKDALLAIRSLAPDARAVLVLAGDDPIHPGVLEPESAPFYKTLYSRYQVEDTFEVARELTRVVGTNATLRVVSLRNRAPVADEQGQTPRAPQLLPVCHSWDEIKARVDESLARAAVREAESDGIDLDKTARDNPLQRPYIAFSRVGEATTMVPKELQQPLQAFMSELEALEGPVDEFVEREMGFAGEQTLATRLSPEQVDALAMMIARLKRGRGHILGDETGIGKGRVLAGLTVWALKRDRPIVFITDKANLFSDLARDLRDIGEWGRVRPFVMNADGRIEDNIGEAGLLADGIKAAEMRRILADNLPLESTGCNVVFTTYSQIAGEDSEKAVWLKNQLKDALLVIDEAHVAAGSDSNISTQIAEMVSVAWAVQYSSATWAKSSANLHIYARALPESVNVATLAKTMKRGGEAFSEVFSSMMAREGALIRREHDLSKLEFVVEIDPVNAERNGQVADRVAEIMSALAFTAGSLKRIVTRMSDLNVAVLRDARDVRSNAETAKIFKSRFGTGSMLYQVMRRVNAALNVKNAVRLAVEGVEAGRKPVIVFEDTGETFVKQALEAQAVTLPDGSRTLPQLIAPPTIKDLLRRMVDTLQMVRVEEVTAEELEQDGPRDEDEADDADDAATLVDQVPGVRAVETIVVPGPAEAAEVPAPAATEDGIVVAEAAMAVDAVATGQQSDGRRRMKATRGRYKLVPFWELNEVSESDRKTFEDGLAEVNRLIESLPDIALNAPDEIARQLSMIVTTSGDAIRVGELSGRSFSLQAQPGHGELCRIIPRPKSKSHVNAVVRAFNGGQLDVLMINRSAATGLSLHASPRFADRRRRQLVEMQIPENPTDRIQLYGRVNRFDQESFPLIQVASTGIYGEVRQIMVQNKKLAEMSASVRSSRESHALIKDVPDLLNSLGREVCRQFLEDNPEILSRLDLSQADIDPKSTRDLAQALTSRVPLLRLEEQKQVYEQVYAMFDDAIVQAELAGVNPLKPNVLDVNATVGPPTLLFGFDHKGLGSAFDGAVFAQTLEWKEDVRPMGLEAVIEIIRVNRSKLIASGRAKSAGTTAGGFPIVDISDLARRASMQLEGRARLAVAGTEFKNSEEALFSRTPNPVRRGLGRAKWVGENLSDLVPGRIISVPTGEKAGYETRRIAVILDVIPPADRRESQLAQWRVLTIAPGEARPVSTTLNALIGHLHTEAVSSQHPGAAGVDDPRSRLEVFSRMDIGSDLIDIHEQPSDARFQTRNSWVYRNFANRFVGERQRKAIVLTGNMYLASEWAAQTKAGTGVIFTDDRGLRHRGVILKDSFRPEWLRYLPSRLWMPSMIEQFVRRLNNGEVECPDGQHIMYSSFDGAWKATEFSDRNSYKDRIIMLPNQGLMMHVGKESRRRVNAMLRQAQKNIKQEVFPGVKVRAQDDPAHVMIQESGVRAQRHARRDDDTVAAQRRKDADCIVLRAETPEKMQRAFQMLMRGPGLEIFVPPSSRRDSIGWLAKQCMRDYYVERLSQAAEGDPVRMAKLQDVLLNESAEEERASAIGAELQAVRAADRAIGLHGDQGNLDFSTGLPVAPPPDSTADEEVPIDVQAIFGAAPAAPRLADDGTGAATTARERMAA